MSFNSGSGAGAGRGESGDASNASNASDASDAGNGATVGDNGVQSREPSTSRRRRNWLIFIAAVVVVAIIGVLIGFAVSGGRGGDAAGKTSTASPSSAATLTPTPSAELSSPRPSPSATADSAPVQSAALPADCYSMFDEDYLSTFGSAELNSPLLGSMISYFADVEALRSSLPGIECRWGGPTEGGTRSSVNSVDVAQQAEAIALVQANGATCIDWEQGIKCRYFSRPVADNPDNWYTAEEFYFRDGLWASSWLAGTVGDETTITTEITSSIVSTLWP